MCIDEYFACPPERRAFFLAAIESCDWSAAKFLAGLLRDGSFDAVLGGGRLFILSEDDVPAAFATLTRNDCIKDNSLYPWIGFVYTFPAYRNRGFCRALLSHASEEAERDGYNQVYLATDHTSLYERMGFEYLENRIDCWGEDSRIYVRKTEVQV